MVEKLLMYHTKVNCLIFYIVPLCIVCYKLKPRHKQRYYAQNDDLKKLVRFWTLYSEPWIISEESKVQCWHSWFNHFLIIVKRLSRKQYIKTLHHHGLYDSDTKRFRAQALWKVKWKVKGRTFWTAIQQFFNKLFNSKIHVSRGPL